MSTWSTLRSRCQNRFVDMSSEEARLRSFLRWPYSNLIQPLDLAKAGMYFIGPGDLVQCAFCQGKLEGWSRGDNPLEEHRQHCFHDETNNFEKKKNKTEGDPDQHKLKELSDTNNPVEEQETAMDNRVEQSMREFNELQEQRLCKVCEDEEINMLFLPCGHLVCCSKCAPTVSHCPISGAAIIDTMRTYLS